MQKLLTSLSLHQKKKRGGLLKIDLCKSHDLCIEVQRTMESREHLALSTATQKIGSAVSLAELKTLGYVFCNHTGHRGLRFQFWLHTGL